MFLSRVFGEEGEGNERKDKPWSRERGGGGGGGTRDGDDDDDDTQRVLPG